MRFYEKYIESLLVGFFGDDFFGRLGSVLKPFIDRGEIPIELGFGMQGQKELDWKIDFLWMDEMKLDDSTFVVPSNSTIQARK